MFRAQTRGASPVMRERVTTIAKELRKDGTVRGPARTKLMETRKGIVKNWMETADVLDGQGEGVLAADVRYFSQSLPGVVTYKEQLADRFARHVQARKKPTNGPCREYARSLSKSESGTVTRVDAGFEADQQG